MQLVPSFWRASGTVAVVWLMGCSASYFYQGYVEHKWWTLGYAESLLIPAAFLVAVVWIAFVPTFLEISDTSLRIKFHFRKHHDMPWSQLKYWGTAESVFMIQFGGRLTFQIFLRAYSSKQRIHFAEFFSSKFPKQKAGGWFGNRGFKWW
jgi:hypothetical protein